MLTAEEKIAIIKRVPLFQSVPYPILEELAPVVQEQYTSANERIISKGEFGETMYLIASGRVKVHSDGTVLAELGSGDVFGEMAALQPQVRIASVTSLEPSLLLIVDHSTLFQLISKQQSFSMGIIEVLSDRARNISELQQRLISQEKFASLGLISSGIAHELKNPLNFVINFSSVAQELIAELNAKHSEVHDQQLIALEELVEKIIHYSKRADNILNRLLQQIMQANTKTNLAPLGAMIQQSINIALYEFRKRAPGFSVEVTFNTDPAIENVRLFSSDLISVITSILDNAFYAMNERKKGSRSFTPNLEITLMKREEEICLAISDNGGGIRPDDLPHLCEPFFTTKAAGVGSGLGLFIAHSLITREYHGTLLINSDHKNSTTATITLRAEEKK